MTIPSDPAHREPGPIEVTHGAGTMPADPDQSGVSQDPTPDLGAAEHAALHTVAGGATAYAILAYEASQIGTGESPPGSNRNKYTSWYGQDGAWCFMFQCYAFDKLGALDLIFGKHAYVPAFKSIFNPHGQFHTGKPKSGDLVAFDFNRSGEPEHIGIVEKVISGSVIQTIEGNTSDRVMRRTRSRSYVYGYATPKYGAGSGDWTEKIMKKLPILKPGDTGYAVWTLQGLLNARVDAKQQPLTIDGGFGPATEARVKQEQAQHKIAADGQVGPHTWSILILGEDVV
jgi:peptidoglycan hydrolase-like protein with peptidoglycan-binding domain